MKGKSVPSKQRQAITWSRILDGYLTFSDCLCLRTCQLAISLQSSVQQEDFRNIRSSFVLRVTIIGIILTLTVFLFSCTTGPRRLPLPPVVSDGPSLQGREEPLYIQRNAAKIVPRMSGSATGSIYADTARPLDLYSETIAKHPGDFINVTIPDPLRFTPKRPSHPGPQRGSSQNDPDKQFGDLVTTPVGSLSETRSQVSNSVTEIKMQVVGVDKGIAYLRSVQTFGSAFPETNNMANTSRRMMTLTAQVPKSLLHGKTISADALTNIEVLESSGGYPDSYTSDGWNSNISRLITGFQPDLESDISRLEAFERQIEVQQQALSDRFQTLKTEQERFKKEQARFFNLRQQVEQRDAAAAAQAQPAPQNIDPANAQQATGENQ